VNRAAVIEQLKQTRTSSQNCFALLEAGEADKFAAHLYQSRRQYRRTCERPNKGNKAIEREIISSFQIAQSWDSRETSAPGSTCCGFTSEIDGMPS
jgi:hypothetical protein